jgi:eukaryotic-like serine/threonine-protein kinase
MNHQRPEDPGTGELIGQRYALVRQIREEPWGAVWLARDQILETEVGLKLWSREGPEWAAGQKVLEQEAVWALKLRHPHILGVYFLGKTSRALYLVQEPFPGESLLAKLTRQHRFSLHQALQLLEHLGETLAFAHRLGVRHRSLSPLHILLQGDEFRLANFAFPPADGDQVIYLELKAYEPPEVLQGDVLTAAGNIFSLGVLGFRLVAGSLPYPLTFDEPFPYRLETLPADLEEIPLPLQNFLLQCLSPDPEERLADAEAFLSQLRQVREQLEPGRREPAVTRQKVGPQRVRQAAAQAGAVLGKIREVGKPLSTTVGKGAQASFNLVKAASRRVWLGLGLAVLILVLLFWGGGKTSQRTEAPPGAVATKTTPVQLAPVGGGPPLTAGEEPEAPSQGAPQARPGSGLTPPATGAAPEAKVKAKPASQERYLLLAATYTSQKQAQDLLKRLKARKYQTKVVSRTSSGKTLYQVQVGPITGAKAAEDAARNLKSQEKITTKVVKMADKTNNKTTKKTGASSSRGPAR